MFVRVRNWHGFAAPWRFMANFGYVFSDRERPVLCMEDFTLFTAAFETDLRSICRVSPCDNAVIFGCVLLRVSMLSDLLLIRPRNYTPTCFGPSCPIIREHIDP